jgi:hypothetical protein
MRQRPDDGIQNLIEALANIFAQKPQHMISVLLEQLEQNILAPITSALARCSPASSSIAIWDSALSKSTSIRPQSREAAVIGDSSVSLLLDKNEEKPSTEAYRTLTDVQNSEGICKWLIRLASLLTAFLNTWTPR